MCRREEGGGGGGRRRGEEGTGRVNVCMGGVWRELERNVYAKSAAIKWKGNYHLLLVPIASSSVYSNL